MPKWGTNLLAGLHGVTALIVEEAVIHPGRAVNGASQLIDHDVGKQSLHGEGWPGNR